VKCRSDQCMYYRLPVVSDDRPHSSGSVVVVAAEAHMMVSLCELQSDTRTGRDKRHSKTSPVVSERETTKLRFPSTGLWFALQPQWSLRIEESLLQRSTGLSS
jgi:hypothetical protein